MDPKTGEIQQVNNVPKNWVGLPKPGDQVEVVAPPNNKRGMNWKVVEIIPGTPGRMIVEPVLETVSKCRKHAERCLFKKA